MDTPPDLRIVEAAFSAGATHVDQLPAPLGLEIAFAGRSNVGKSSLMNAVMGRRHLVRTSSTPGCTRQISFYETRSVDGAVITLVDLPGYGYAKRSKSERRAWAEMIEGYLKGRPTLSVVAALVDLRRGIEADDQVLLDLLAGEADVARHQVRSVLVATKTDKVPLKDRKLAMQALEKQAGRRVLPFSTKLPALTPKLWRTLRRSTGMLDEAPAGDPAAPTGSDEEAPARVREH